MPAVAQDLWSLTWGRPHIDPRDLAAAVEQQAARSDQLDFRTRLLIRDSIRAIEKVWGKQRTRAWLDVSPQRDVIDSILHVDFGADGFRTLNDRVMTTVKPDDILEYLRTLGSRATQPARLIIGGSIALILAGQLSRPTDAYEDELVSDHLPAGWENRTHSFGVFGPLQVLLLDSYDIALSKLFSPRTKDFDDLRVLKPHLDKQRLSDRLIDTTAAFLADASLKKHAQHNWYILFGEPLPERKQP
jgi:hypothetical protein